MPLASDISHTPVKQEGVEASPSSGWTSLLVGFPGPGGALQLGLQARAHAAPCTATYCHHQSLFGDLRVSALNSQFLIFCVQSLLLALAQMG